MRKCLKWCACLSVMNWMDEIVIYQQQTGDTHLFSGFPAKVIKFCLSKEAFSITEIMDQMQGFCGDRQNSADDIELIMNNLLQKHLIVSC